MHYSLVQRELNEASRRYFLPAMKNERGPTSETRLDRPSELPEINDFDSGPLAARTRNDTRTLNIVFSYFFYKDNKFFKSNNYF